MAENELTKIFTKKVADLPVWAWGLIGIAGIGVGIFILKKTTAPKSAIPTTPTDTTGGVTTSATGDTGQSGTGLTNLGLPSVAGQVTNPQLNQEGVPTVAPGPNYTPILDSNGNLVGWSNTPVNQPPVIPPPGKPPAHGTPGVDYPLVPFNEYNGPDYSNLKPNTHWTWAGVSYLLSTGSGGRLYGTNPQGHKLLLRGPASTYPA